MAADVAVHGSRFGAGVGKVHGGCAREAAALVLVILDRVGGGDRGGGDGGRVGRRGTEDVNLSLLAVTAGDVREAHVVGEGVDDAALLRGERRREDKCFAGVVVAEEEEL